MHIEGRPKIAIIDPNTLAALGLYFGRNNNIIYLGNLLVVLVFMEYR